MSPNITISRPSVLPPVSLTVHVVFRCCRRRIVLSSIFYCRFSHVEVYADFKIVAANQHDGASATQRAEFPADQLAVGVGHNDAERKCHNK